MLSPQLAAEGPFGPLLAQDPVLLGGEGGPPLAVGLDELARCLGMRHSHSLQPECGATMTGATDQRRRRFVLTLRYAGRRPLARLMTLRLYTLSGAEGRPACVGRLRSRGTPRTSSRSVWRVGPTGRRTPD